LISNRACIIKNLFQRILLGVCFLFVGPPQQRQVTTKFKEDQQAKQNTAVIGNRG
jgi:hypothetical protein